jgi:hypothetical protein
MSPNFKKIYSRLRTIFNNTAYLALPPVLNALVPILIIKYHQIEWWGQIVELNLIATIANVIIAWGNKDYLIKIFSTEPTQRYRSWGEITSVRATCLLLPALIGVGVYFDYFTALNLGIWIISRFIAQAYEPVIVFERRYWDALSAELMNFVMVLVGIIALGPNLGFESLLLILSLGSFVKAATLSGLFRQFSRTQIKLNFNWRSLTPLTNMMLITLTGLFVSKIDLVIVTMTMQKDQLAHYQILLSFAALIQSGAAYIFLPYLKSFYRISSISQKKIQLTLFQIGLGICIAAIPVLYPLMKYLYHLRLNSWMIFGVFSYALAGFVTTPLGYKFYELGKSKWVLFISISSIFIFIGLFLGLTFWFNLDTGHMVALAGLHQILLTSLFLFFSRRASKLPAPAPTQ